MILYTHRYKNLPPKHQYINHSRYVQSSRRLRTVAWDYMPPNILTLKLSCKFEFPCKSFHESFLWYNRNIYVYLLYSTFFVAALLFNISETLVHGNDMIICKYLFTFKDTRMQFGLIGIKRCIYSDSRCIHIASNCNSLKTKMTCKVTPGIHILLVNIYI